MTNTIYNMENKMQIENLIENFYSESITDDEMVFLLNYLKDKEPQHEILSYYQVMWDKAGEYNETIDSKSSYDKIVRDVIFSRVGLKSATESQDRVGFRGYIRTFMRYAAVFVFAFGLFWLTQSILFRKTTTPEITAIEQISRIEVPYGSKSHIVLPDGSIVTLNSGSILKYSSSDFSINSRSVSMEGEGFFSISKDSTRPFYVTTQGIKIKVLGTTFNLRAYPDEDFEEATIVSGVVEIYASADKTQKSIPIILKPNQSAVFVKSQNSLQKKDTIALFRSELTSLKLRTINLQSSSKTEQTISWKENKLIFDNELFSSLVIRIERWYDVKILVNYPELNSVRFTGKFDKETLEQVLNALVTVTPFNYNIKQNNITISKKINI